MDSTTRPPPPTAQTPAEPVDADPSLPNATLATLSHLLTLLHHRNKNQHRRSSWWRHFSTFRRRVRWLADLEAGRSGRDAKGHKNPGPATTTTCAGAGAAAEDAWLLSDAECRIWADVYVVRWYGAFSQLVAERRFAALGIVLLGVLARVCALLGVAGEAAAAAGDVRGGCKESQQEEVMDSRDEEVDVGVVVRRENVGILEEDPNDDDRGSTEVSEDDEAGELVERRGRSRQRIEREKRTKKAKKRKPGNSIDDIFSVLF